MHNQNPARCWRGFVWRGSFASLMALRKTFLRDCSRFGTDSIVGGGRPFHQPAVAPIGSPGSMPGGVSSMRSLLVSGCVRRAGLCRPGLRPLPKHSACRTTTPQRTESIRPSRRRVNGKNIRPYTDHIAPRHTARFALSFSLAERIWPRMASHSASPSFESAEKFPVPPRCPAPSMAIVWPVR